MVGITIARYEILELIERHLRYLIHENERILPTLETSPKVIERASVI